MYLHKLKVCCNCLVGRPSICLLIFFNLKYVKLVGDRNLVLSHILLGQRDTNVLRA